MRPMHAALTGALVAGAAMFAVGTRASQFTAPPQALVQTADGGYATVPADQLKAVGTFAQGFSTNRPIGYVSSPGYVTTSAPVRTVTQTRPATRVVERTTTVEQRPKRSWQKSAMIIGGSAASGAGVGAIVGGKKGALIGTALGGGAASIYEATRH